MQAAAPDFGNAETRLVFDNSRFQQDFFQLFGLPPTCRLDNALLERHYHALQEQVHPDKFSHLSEAERRVSMQWATRVNEAFQTLSNPVMRARYLLSLHGIDIHKESAMGADFLMEQMEWREAIEEALRARDASELDKLESRLQHEMRGLEAQLAASIDDRQDYAAAAGDARKLRFLEKLAEEIASAFDAIDI